MNLPNISVAVVGPLLGVHSGYVPTQGEQLRDLLKNEGYCVYSVSSQKNRYFRLIHIIFFLLFGPRTNAVILQIYSGMSFVVEDIASFIVRLQKRYLIMHLHGGSIPNFTQSHPAWTKRVYLRANRIVIPSKFLLPELEELGLKAQVIPNIVDFKAYVYKPRRKLNPKFIWMRAFHPIYNPEMAVRFFYEIIKKWPDATLVMAGQKGNEEEIKSLARSLGVESKICFAGFLNEFDKRREMERADIFINTNKIDNMPVSVIEAWAFGLPVISTDVGGIPYLIEDGQTGALVNDGDYRAMAGKAEELLRDPELAGRLSINGRKKAEECSWQFIRFGWEAILKRVEESEG